MHLPRTTAAWILLICSSVAAQTVIRGPYLQRGTPNAMTVRWRTDTTHTGSVRYGTTPNQLTQLEQEDAAETDHEVTLTGLQPNTVYYYAVYDGETALTDGSEYYFKTPPEPGQDAPCRIWVLGDPGTGYSDAYSVFNAYQNRTGTNHTDLILTLADNAYNEGRDSEFQSGFFDVYPEILRQTPVYPSFGNHDGRYWDNPLQTAPYFDIFTLPVGGECGGTASGTEAYYSLDFGRIHLICLDSFESDRSTAGAMYAWAAQDLAACTSQWIIAYFHHAPYSKGTHDSDDDYDEPEMVEMRENFIPLLEAHGVDLVLGGHSHTYERSYLINGHHGHSSGFSMNAHALHTGSGEDGANGPYMKPAILKPPQSGTVHIVCGTSGKLGDRFMDEYHPAMQTNILDMGSLILEITGNRLDLTFLSLNNTILDAFTILKGDIDYDGDGMSDLWEQEFLRTNVLPTGNPDDDQHNNLEEYVAGTDPADATSVFLADGKAHPSGFVLQWESTSNRTYTIRRSDALTNTPDLLAADLPFPQNSYTDTVHAAENTGFYTVDVQPEE